ncbi:hypothetical protein GCM10022259_14390 [Aquimarina mytili]
MVGTITIIDESPVYNSYNFFYRKKNVQKGHRINIKPNQGGLLRVLKPDYQIGSRMVFQFALEHIPGDYEFWSYSLFSNYGFYQEYYSPKNHFSVPFTLKEGTITYIGDLTFYPKGNTNGFTLKWTDNYSKDIEKLKGRYPKFNWESIENDTPKEGYDLLDGIIEF